MKKAVMLLAVLCLWLNLSGASLAALQSSDLIYLRLFKLERKLEIWYSRNASDYQLYNSYAICTYSGGLGPKYAEGDQKSPEGFYSTNKRLLNPNSQYHLSFNIGYPNAYDRANGYTGSFLMVHGNCVSVGCYAMTDAYIEQIYAVVENALNGGQKGVPVHIFPFQMDEKTLLTYRGSKYYPFWQQLKPAYDYFEKHRQVPRVVVENKQYVVKQ